MESLNDGLLTWEPPTATYEPAPPAPAPGAPGSGPAGTMGRPRTAWAPEDVMAAGESKATVTPSSTSYDYPDPDWSHFSGLGTAVMEDGVPNPVRKILTFATEPLEEDLEVIGSIVLNLWASSDQTDTDFFVRLTDQFPDAEQVPGMPPRALMLTRGWLKASHAATKDEAKSLPYRPYYRHDKPEPFEPGQGLQVRDRGLGDVLLASRRATGCGWTSPATTRTPSTSAATTTGSRWGGTPSITTRTTRRTSCCR